MDRAFSVAASVWWMVVACSSAVGCQFQEDPSVGLSEGDGWPGVLVRSKISVIADFCTIPEGMPNSKTRVLFILDRSQSMAVSDSWEDGQSGVARAVRNAIDSRLTDQRTSFGIVRFGFDATCLTDTGIGCFTRDSDRLV